MLTADDEQNICAIREGFISCLPFPIEIDVNYASTVFPVCDEERLLVQRAVPGRQADFITGRWCAHQALHRIGVVVSAITVGPRGEPNWPPEVSGSITHESGLCIAVVTKKTIVQSIGIDLLNSHRPTDFESFSYLVISQADSFKGARSITGSERVMLMFAAKEAVVKAVSAKIGRYIEMTEIELTVQEDGAFNAAIRAASLLINGQWRRVNNFVLAAAYLLNRRDSEVVRG